MVRTLITTLALVLFCGVLFFSFGGLLKGSSGTIEQFFSAPLVELSVKRELRDKVSIATGDVPQDPTERPAGWLKQMLENVLTPQSVQLSGIYYASEGNIHSKIDGYLASSVFPPRTSALSRVLEESPWIERASPKWSIFPLALAVTVKEAHPWIVAVQDEESWLVSDGAETLQTLESIRQPELIIRASELPRLRAAPELERHVSSSSVLAALRVIELAGGMPFPCDEIELQHDGSFLFLPRERETQPMVRVSAGTFSESSRSLERLRKVLSDLEARGERAISIDLRFDNQVVVMPEPATLEKEGGSEQRTLS